MTCHAASARCTRSMTDGIAVIERVLSRPTADEGGAMASLHGACRAWPTLRSFLHSKWLAKKSREVYEKLLAKSWGVRTRLRGRSADDRCVPRGNVRRR